MALEFQSISELGKMFASPFAGHLDDIFVVVDSNSNPMRVYVRHGAHLTAFNVTSEPTKDEKKIIWKPIWNRQIFNAAQRPSYPLRTYPWLVTDTMLDDGSDGIIIRNEAGLGFYRFDPTKSSDSLQELSRDSGFRDLYGWNEADRAVVLIGRFYPDTRLVGILSRKKKMRNESVVEFYCVDKDGLMTRTPYPLLPLQESRLDKEMVTRMAEAVDLYVAKIQRGSGQDHIIFRTKTHQLEMYKFNDNYALEPVAKLSLVDGLDRVTTERFFFVDLTGQHYRDVIHFNSRGWFVYQMTNNNNTDYTLVHFHAGFSETNGWIAAYGESIRLVDTNGDGRDDLIFTGPKGLTVLEFDPEALRWKTLLDPSSAQQLAVSQRFATVAAALTSGTESSSILLTVDKDNKLHMGRLTVQKIQPEAFRQSVSSQAVQPVNEKMSSHEKIPAQVKRIISKEKPVARWTEQWAEPLTISDLVDPVSGSLDFSLPIFEPTPQISDPDVPHRISLSYSSSQSTTFSNIVGSGWALSLPDTYILVDYQGSVFLEDAKFYLSIDGGLLQLKSAGQQDDGVRLFREPFRPQWIIEYHIKEQRWIIATEADRYIFGAKGKLMKTIRWNLNWPQWRGPGNDVESLKPIPVAWYLIERQVKATGRSISYEYEIDSVSHKNPSQTKWTAAIRLKRIRVESFTTITFDYAKKEKEEFQQLIDGPFDSGSHSLVFPVPLLESHYLKSCNIVTDQYSQRLEFKYETDSNGRRLLTAIEQPIAADVRESIFHFSYDKKDPPKLNEIKFPQGLKVNFQYDTIPSIDLPDPYASVAHPVEEQPALDYSHDYAAMVFRQRQLPGQILVKILGVDWLETLAELSPMAATTTTQPEDKVVSYSVRSHSEFLVVLLETEKKQKKMCLYHRKIQEGNKRKWIRDPTCHRFSRDAMIRSSEAGVAIANGSSKTTGVVQLFELSTDQSKWMERRFTSGRSAISFEMSGHFIVGYDDHQIFICHPDATNSQWRMRILQQLPNLFRDGSAILAKFPPEIGKILLETLKQNLIQLSGNSIAVSSLHLDDGHQLSLRIRLFLLSANYNRSRRREFTVQAENVLQLRSEFNDEGSRYQLGYRVINDGSYRVKLFNLSGNKVDEILTAMKEFRVKNFEELKKNVTIQRDVDFKSFDSQIQEEFEKFVNVITSPGIPNSNNTEETQHESKSCDDVMFAPCNDQCHKMEGSFETDNVALVIQSRRNFDKCRADDWKEKWENNVQMELQQLKEKQNLEMSELETEWTERGIDSGSSSNVTREHLLIGEKSFQQFFLINWSACQTKMFPDGLLAGNETFIRMRGDDWEKETANKPTVKNNQMSIPLGQSFVLLDESDESHQFRNMTLYGQDPVNSNQTVGPPLHRLLEISPPDRIINRYPAYLAYGIRNGTKLILFSDGGKTLGNVLTLANEQLVSGSYERLTTLSQTGETMKLLSRSLRSIHPAIADDAKRSAVHLVKMSNSDGSQTRSTGYQWDPVSSAKGNVTVTIIPGNDRKLGGWIQETWRPEKIPFTAGRWIRTALEMFDSAGRPVQQGPAKNKSDDPSSTNDDCLLWDSDRRRIISDFSPYKTSDQTISYYGFESYELNSSQQWRFAESNVMEGGFALTGSNFLRLNQQSPLEGSFTPVDQQSTVYVASGWIRPSGGLLESTMEEDLEITAHLKAIVTVKETEIVRLLGRMMRKAGDWSYLEVLIDFDIVHHLFNSRIGDDRQQDPKFTITIRIEAQNGTSVDVDHVRFSPMAHDFQATVYDHGRPVSVIGSSGSISRTVYYRGRPMAVVTDVGGQLEQVTTSTYTGRLVLPTPKGSFSIAARNPPCRIVFYPQNGGLHEIFDAYSLRNRWNDPDVSAWTTAPGRLWHNHPQSHSLASVDPSALFGEESSAAVRCYYSLISPTASMTWKWKNGQVQLIRNKSPELSSTLNFTFKNKTLNTVTHLTNSGELIFMTEGERFFVWIDSVLLLDQFVASAASWSSFSFEAQGNSFVEDCVFMGNPRTEIEYVDDWGQKMQTIQLESDTSVLVSQILYDSLGRPAITTKLTRVTVDSRKPLLTYHSNFVSGPIDPAHPLSVWQNHRLEGEVDRLNPLDGGVAYFRTEYEANPLNEKQVRGQPGPDFGVNGPYAMKFRSSLQKDEIDVVDNHFPANQGFRHRLEEMPNGTKKVAVLDGQDNRVALYVYVPGYDHLLSTYEYDSGNRLVKMLPPMYHERVDTFGKTASWNNNRTSPEDIRWQKRLGTFLSYDEETGRLIRKTTPDSGFTEYYYNRAGQLRLQVHSKSEESAADEIDSVVYYEYDAKGVVRRTGFLEQMPMDRQEFQKSLQNGTLSNAKDYQLIDRTEAEERHYDPSLSEGDRNVTLVTHNDDDYIVIEDMRWDSQDRLLESRRVDQADFQIRKTYFPHSDRLRSIQYPDGIQLEHCYNKLGQLTGLKLAGQSGDLIRFTYHGSGQLDSEYHLPGSEHGFNRTFHYNSPGYLERIADPFLSQSVSYTDGGYGQGGSGDGIVMQTTFSATWPPNSDWRWFQVADLPASQICLEALKRNGFMTQTGRPIKDYPSAVDEKNPNWMPLVCGGRTGQRLSQILAQKRMPRVYGHRYAYGNHQELVKAKYFTEETDKWAVPFQPDTLANQTALTKQQSRDIWKQIDKAGFIMSDGDKGDWLTAVADRGSRPLVRRGDLDALLRSASTPKDDVTLYQNLIEMMILNDVGHGRNNLPELDEFQNIFRQWKGVGGSAEPFRRAVDKIHKDLKVKGNATGWLDAKLVDIFHPHSNHLADFIRILNRQWTYGLGEHPFDVASYEIDANGNHRKFYVGFNRYEFSYGSDRVNQIRSVQVEELGKLDDGNSDHPMDHDSHGNVIKALHKRIERIEYNGASRRTSAIHLTDGRKIRFAYDAQGERILKRVLTGDGQQLTEETHYVRDEEGRVLYDRRIAYSPEFKSVPVSIVSTSYIYGLRGLAGFIRNGAFHSVWTDHSGSIRLVLKDGQVVAAYDYLPYGQLMRSYGNDPSAGIFYRYTGQEWDQETGLYNYHARLYDPDIGRFYQPDPREQYFSPYKYVGNSPVSLIDPDGEIGFVMVAAMVILALGGAFLSAAAINKKWNPGQWDWTSSKTWLGILGGGISGAVIPGFAVTAVATVGITATVLATTGVAYVSAAAANDHFDLSKWDWKNPGTYNALFEGVGTGVGIFAGARMAHQLANKFGTIGKNLVLTGTSGSAMGWAYGKGVSANKGEWNPAKWSFDPGTLYALMEGFDTGIGLPTDLAQMARGIHKLASKNSKQLKTFLTALDNVKMKKFKPVLASIAKGPIGKAATGALTAYVMAGMANEHFDPNNWDGTSINTYESFLNGLFLGLNARKMLKTSGGKPTSRRLGGNAEPKTPAKVYSPALGRSFDNMWETLSQSVIGIRQPNQNVKLSQSETVGGAGLTLLRHDDGSGLQYSASSSSQDRHTLAGNTLKELQVETLATIEIANHRKRKRKEQIFTDDESVLFGCFPVKRRRRKRAETRKRPATSCQVAKPDTEMQKKMKQNPVGVLQQVAISTKSIADWPDLKEHKIPLINGGAFGFNLIPDAITGSNYHLKVGLSYNNQDAVRGYWMNTNDKIQIDPLGDAQFIFTGELQSCSIYVKYNYDVVPGKNGRIEPTMTVYHHNRRFPDAIYWENGRGYVHDGKEIGELKEVTELFDGKGNKLKLEKDAIVPMGDIFYRKYGQNFKLTKVNGKKTDDMIQKNVDIQKKEDELAKEYDQVIRYEDYLGFPGNYNDKMTQLGQPVTFATPVLFRDNADGHWYFSSQKISYTKGFLDKENFQSFSQLRNYVIQNPNQKLSTIETLYLLQNKLESDFFIKQLGSIPRSRLQAASLSKRKFTNQQEYKEFMESFNEAGNRKPVPVKRSNDISVRDLDFESPSKRGRLPRSVLMQLTGPLEFELLSSKASRSGSWIDLISPGHQILKSIFSLNPILQLVKLSLSPEDATENRKILELSPQLTRKQTNYRDVSIDNCYYSISPDAPVVVCYGYHGKTTVFSHSPRVDPLRQDTYSHCRPIEWHGQPSVTCRGEETSFIHTPYNRNSGMANLFNAVDGWLMLVQVGPAMYRELIKLAGHLKNVWTGSSGNQMNLPISDQDKESWQEQLGRLEQLVAEKQEQSVDWALPLMAELKEQIVSLSGKSQTETRDDVRAVKTMSERLSALTEDVGEEQDDEEIFYDCLEEFSNEPRFELTGAEWLSTRLHHLIV